MKAIRVHEFGGPEVMRMEEVPDLKPGAGQAVVRVKAAGVNPADTYIRTGTYVRKPALPYTPGMDAAGTVEAVGSGVTHVAVGARVYIAGTTSGAYAEQALCEESQVHPLPQRASFAQGAGVGVPCVTAYRALFQLARPAPGETLLVHGATGAVGLAAVQMGRTAGLRVIGTGGTEKGRVLVAKEGAHEVLDHRAAGYLDRLMELTGGRGVDVILEMLANVNLGKDLQLLAKGGRVVVVGSRGTVEINPRDAMSRDAAIFSMTVLNLSEQQLGGIHAAMVAGLESGVLRPVVAEELPLKDASHAHQKIMEPGACGKIVLVP